MWSWWCRGPLRRFWHERASKEALALMAWEIGPPRIVPGKPEPPQTFAVELSAAMGFGTPDEWRRVRWRDAVHIAAFKGWLNEAPKEGMPKMPKPVWGQPAPQPPGLTGEPADPNFRQVA